MRSLTLLVPAMLAVAGPAIAQEIASDGQRIEMLGTAAAACVLDAPHATNAANATFSGGGTGAGNIVITQFVDPQTASPLPSSIELALPVVCNASHQLTVRSGNGGLLRLGGNPSNRQGNSAFADFVAYDLSLDWAGKAITQPTDGGTILVSASNARAGEIGLRISTPGGGSPLTAGRYDDTIIVEFRAAN